jgi:tRNA(Ile)-lysidine synthase
MIAPGDRVLVAVSGGSDSIGLLHLLAREAPRHPFRLAVAHFDHGLRPGSADDAGFVRTAAQRLGLPFHGAGADVRALARAEKRSIEDAARAARHRFLRAALREWNGDRIALAHQAEDLCEGILMRLAEGTGLAGLAGMRPVQGPIIRPLLGVRRAQIRAWLEGAGLGWREDESNASLEPLRNRVRHRLVPLLEAEFNPAVVAAIAGMAGVLADEDRLLEDWVDEWFERQAATQEPPATLFSLPRAPLASAPAALQRRILKRALLRAGVSPRRVRRDQIETIVRLLGERRSGSRVTIGGGFTAIIERRALVLRRG